MIISHNLKRHTVYGSTEQMGFVRVWSFGYMVDTSSTGLRGPSWSIVGW
jgi:hypothetical protein